MINYNSETDFIKYEYCVYRLNFNEGFYYFGRTKNPIGRLSEHLSYLKDRKQPYLRKSPNVNSIISMDILYVTNDKIKCLDQENLSIMSCNKDPKCLNSQSKKMIPPETINTIVSFLCDGLTLRQVGRVMNIDTRALEKFMSDLRKEYGCKNMVHLVAVIVSEQIEKEELQC